MQNNLRQSAQNDWELYYASRETSKNLDDIKFTPIDLTDFRNRPTKILIEKIRKYLSDNDTLIEIGAGDSELLVDVCKRFPVQCSGLDYLESACELLQKRIDSANAEVTVINTDMFNPPKHLLRKFDFVMSLGVVEHFNDLVGVVSCISSYAKPGGIVFTLIPNNKNTIYGWLMKIWNIDVFNAHVMYDKHDLENAHKKADLEILASEYLVSSNFGMLSWCFASKKQGLGFWIYKQLTRVSKILWLFEDRFGFNLASRCFSPYILCVAKVKK